MDELTIQEVSWHRNGSGGEGFYAIRFLCTPDDEESRGEPERFLGILFDDPGHCAIISISRLDKCGVTFARNSWRGDRFEDELRQAVATHSSSGSIRMGPFGFPTE